MSGDFISDKTTIIQSEPLTPAMMWNVVNSKVYFLLANIAMLMVYLCAKVCFTLSVHSVLQASASNFCLIVSLLFLFSAVLVSENSHNVERR